MTTHNSEETYHVPVMLKECIEGLQINPDGVYVDLTFGGGGHSKEIFNHLSDKGKLIVFDQDAEAVNNGWDAPNFFFVNSNFAFLKNQLRMLGVKKVDGILADLGVSSHQFNAPERGFSIRANEKLDMRMNQAAAKSATHVVNEYEEEELLAVFRSYSDLKNAYRVVETICRMRQQNSIETTGELMDALNNLAPKHRENKFFAQVFQAIRIEVNDEMNVLKAMLEQTVAVLKPHGRLVVMAYHSLEDRLVKNYVKRGSFDGKIEKDFYGNILKPFNDITRKPIVPSEQEVLRNPRARSAKLRIAERNEGE